MILLHFVAISNKIYYKYKFNIDLSEKRILNKSLDDFLFEDLGDVLEVVVREPDVDDVLLQLRALVHRVEQVADLGLEVRLANLPLPLLLAQQLVLVLQVVDLLLQPLVHARGLRVAQTAVRVLGLHVLVLLGVEQRLVLQPRLLRCV